MRTVTPTDTPLWSRILGWAGFAAHLATLVWYAASGLLAPLWAVIALLVVWLLLAIAAWRLLRTAPRWVPAVPVAAAIVWFAALSAGETFLGWSA
jgi:hypothetical protein